MKLVIPIFHTEFDALKVSYNRFGEIPPSGDFGDFWWLLWLLTLASLVYDFSDYYGLILHSLVVILAYVEAKFRQVANLAIFSGYFGYFLWHP